LGKWGLSILGLLPNTSCPFSWARGQHWFPNRNHSDSIHSPPPQFQARNRRTPLSFFLCPMCIWRHKSSFLHPPGLISRRRSPEVENCSRLSSRPPPPLFGLPRRRAPGTSSRSIDVLELLLSLPTGFWFLLRREPSPPTFL